MHAHDQDLLLVGTIEDADPSAFRKAIHHIHHQVEPVQIVLHPHVKGRCDRALFYIAAHVQIAVGAAVGQPVDQPRVTMKGKDDVLVFGKQRIVVFVAESVRVLGARLQLHKINNIDHPDLQFGEMLAQDRNGGQSTAHAVGSKGLRRDSRESGCHSD